MSKKLKEIVIPYKYVCGHCAADVEPNEYHPGDAIPIQCPKCEEYDIKCILDPRRVYVEDND